MSRKHIGALTLTSALSLGASSPLWAAQITDYTTSSFSSSANNARIIPVQNILNSGSVQYSGSESAATSRLELCPGSTCGSSAYTAQSSGTPLGVVSLSNGNVQFSPNDPAYVGTVAIPYRVVNNEDSPSTIATIFITVNGPVPLSANYQAFQAAFNNYCDANANQGLVIARCQDYRGLTGNDFERGLMNITPDEVLVQSKAVQGSAMQQIGNITNRLNQLRGGVRALSVAGFTYRSGSQQLSGKELQELAQLIGGNAGDESTINDTDSDSFNKFSPASFFVNGAVNEIESKDTTNPNAPRSESTSITLGGDYRLNSNLVAGIAYGIGKTDTTFTANGEFEDKNQSLMAYSAWTKGTFYVDSTFGYSVSDLNTERDVTLGAASTSRVTSFTQAQKFFASISGNFDFVEDNRILSSYSGLTVVDGYIDSYDELGNTGLELRFQKQKVRNIQFTMGLRAQYTLGFEWGVITPHARLEWKRNLDEDLPNVKGSFVLDASQQEFVLASNERDPSWYEAALGASAVFPHGISAYIDYRHNALHRNEKRTATSGGIRWEMPL